MTISKTFRKRVAVVILAFFAGMGIYLASSRGDPTGAINATRCDVGTSEHRLNSPKKLSQAASARIRRAYSGLGRIAPSGKGPIPHAVFEIDGVKLAWTGAQIERRDYPLRGLTTSWTFEDGKTVESSPRLRDADPLDQLIELWGEH